MKNLFKKIAAVVSVAALSLSMAAFPVSADEVSTDEYQLKFYNADGSINMTGVNKLIDDQNNFYKEVLKNNRSSVDSVNVNNSTFFYYASNPVYVENMKNFINDRFETVYEDGHYYLILDGEKVEYYFGDNKFYYNRASYVIPSSRCSVDPNLASDYDTLSYIQKYDLWNTVSMYRKESIVYEMAIMPNAYDFSVNLYKFSSDDYKDISNEEMVKEYIKCNFKEFSDVENDANGNNELDSDDALITLQYATNNQYSELIDIDNDGNTSSYDALRILQKIVQ